MSHDDRCASPEQTADRRWRSVDAMRGLAAVSLLIGITAVPVLALFPDGRFAAWLARQLSPSVWHGLTFFDFLFPAFLFVSGMSVRLASGPAGMASGTLRTPRVLGRAALLLAIGLVIDSGWPRHWPHLRLAGWFQQLALCYAVAALLYPRVKLRYLAALWCLLVVDYGAVLHLGAGSARLAYAMVGNVAQRVDALLLPGRKYFGDWDPQGVLTTIPALLLTVAGVITGEALFHRRAKTTDMPLLVAAGGMAVLLAGLLASVWLPINAYLLTPPFVCITAGSLITLAALLSGLLDRRPAAGGTAAGGTATGETATSGVRLPLLAAAGRNALLVVLVARLIPFEPLRARTSRAAVGWLSVGSSSVLLLVATLVAVAVALRWLAARRWFLTVSWAAGPILPDPPAAAPASAPPASGRPCGERPSN